MWAFRTWLYIITVSLFWSGCSEPEIIIPPLDVSDSRTSVVVEYLTGVRCPNCPSASARLESIKSVYPENVFIVSIHGELLTKPLESSQYDLRSPDAIMLEAGYRPIIGKPSAVINRKTHPEFSDLANPIQDRWLTIIERELNSVQMASLGVTLAEEENTTILDIEILPFSEELGEVRLHVYLLDNELFDAQEDTDRVIQSYRHDHVLRKVVTPYEGEDISEILESNVPSSIPIRISESDISTLDNPGAASVLVFISGSEGIIQATEIQLNQ